MLTVVTLLFLTGLFENLPEATLAAVVIAAVIELVDVGALVRLLRPVHPAPRPHLRAGGAADFIAAVAAMLGVLVFDTLPGLVIGIVVSLLLLLYRASKPHIAELGRVAGNGGPVRRRGAPPGERRRRPASPCCASSPGCSSPTPRRSGGRSGAHAAAPGTRGVVLDAEAIAFVDVTAVRMLDELAEELARATASSS